MVFVLEMYGWFIFLVMIVVWFVILFCVVRIVCVVCMLWIFLGFVLFCIRIMCLFFFVRSLVLLVENIILLLVVLGDVGKFFVIMLWLVLGLREGWSNWLSVVGFKCWSVFFLEIRFLLIILIVILRVVLVVCLLLCVWSIYNLFCWMVNLMFCMLW